MKQFYIYVQFRSSLLTRESAIFSAKPQGVKSFKRQYFATSEDAAINELLEVFPNMVSASVVLVWEPVQGAA